MHFFMMPAFWSRPIDAYKLLPAGGSAYGPGADDTADHQHHALVVGRPTGAPPSGAEAGARHVEVISRRAVSPSIRAGWQADAWTLASSHSYRLAGR